MFKNRIYINYLPIDLSSDIGGINISNVTCNLSSIFSYKGFLVTLFQLGSTLEHQTGFIPAENNR